jgi:AbiV family abortive infection protein
MKKKLDSYTGRLTPVQIATGMNAAAANALRLAEDAEILLKKHRYPTAASLAVLSIEEAGKVAILRSLSLAKTNADLLDGWKQYRSHARKNVSGLFPQLFAAGARKLEDFRPMFEENAEHTHLLDQLKQLGFYTDCLGKAHWSSPNAVIDGTLAHMLVKTAKLLATHKSEHTQKEVDLWVEHMGPVWKKDLHSMKRALASWYSAMKACGLFPEGSNEMAKFIDFVN